MEGNPDVNKQSSCRKSLSGTVNFCYTPTTYMLDEGWAKLKSICPSWMSVCPEPCLSSSLVMHEGMSKCLSHWDTTLRWCVVHTTPGCLYVGKNITLTVTQLQVSASKVKFILCKRVTLHIHVLWNKPVYMYILIFFCNVINNYNLQW